MESTERGGSGKLTIKLARNGRAAVKIAKAAAAGGLQGAAVAAAKEYAPELIRLVTGVVVTLLVLALMILMAIPSAFYGFGDSGDSELAEITEQAKTLGGVYYGMESFQKAEISSAVTGISSRYTASGETVDTIEVDDRTGEDGVLWFIAISSVAARQEVASPDIGQMRRAYLSSLQYASHLTDTVLHITVSAPEPDVWMEELGFDEETKAWAHIMHDTLLTSGAYGEYAKEYEAYIPSLSGDTQYGGAYWRGEGNSNEIDVGQFCDPATKNNRDLAAFAQQAWENNWGYVWGTFGGVLNRSLLDYKIAQYPNDVGGDRAFIATNYLNRRTTDCVGLIKGYGWLDAATGQIGYATNGMPDLGADGMYESAVAGGSAHGDISHMPEIPGLCLWKPGHAGVYVGGGYVIEALNTRAGVVKTKLHERGWQAWYQNPYISDTQGG